MKRKWLFYVTFFTLLILGFYYGLTRALPGFGKVKLPVLAYVRPFSFINQDGERITEKEVDGKVYVAEYFFTTCHGICPILNRNMKTVYEEFKTEPRFLILSHTCDPANDNIARLKHYSDSLGVNNERWWFLTGDKEDLYQAARVSYLLDDPKNNAANIDEQFLHTQFFALVDKAGQVRKIYDGLKKDEISELKREIRELLEESPGKQFRSDNVIN